ncbi:MAG: response regulator [Endomicrobiia bacterium]
MKKIFIADDDKDLVEVMTLKLKQEGYEVDSAFTGKETLNKIPEVLPDLMILDVKLPDLDGVTLSNKLRENEKTRNIPIIVLTGTIGAKELFMVENQISAYFQKPVLLSTLVKKIKELLNE